jgi:hypothetical protein
MQMSARRTVLSVVVVALGIVRATIPVVAHHSFAAEYDGGKPVTLKGTINRMVWSNPHAWLYVDVKGPDNSVKTWAVEFGGPNALYRRGWRKTDLPVGQPVTVDGFLAKDGSTTANASNVVLADGRKLFAGSSGEGAPPGASQP